jgi:phage gp36-like protein
VAAPYCTNIEVKVVLQIAADDEGFDGEIDDCITSADALIDKLLAKDKVSVPAEVPHVIADASAYLAAWLFRRRRDPVGAEAYYAEAIKFLEVYASSEGEVAFKVVSDQ